MWMCLESWSGTPVNRSSRLSSCVSSSAWRSRSAIAAPDKLSTLGASLDGANAKNAWRSHVSEGPGARLLMLHGYGGVGSLSAARIFVIASSIAASNADPELDPSGAAPAAALVDAAAAADDSDRRTGALLESETSRGRFRFRLGRVERISEWQQRSLRRGAAPPFYRPFSEPRNPNIESETPSCAQTQGTRSTAGVRTHVLIVPCARYAWSTRWCEPLVGLERGSGEVSVILLCLISLYTFLTECASGAV